MSVNVNLSAHDFLTRDLDKYIENLLHALQLPGSAISFEITESVLMQNREAAVKMIDKLRTIGSTISEEATPHWPISRSCLLTGSRSIAPSSWA